ncbi:hypothetical protein VQH23_09020 [Pararoseomonas sp. SCSIO 73927]|uniref:hypothetical protein n=1 Tax=Pararoseomonas sp. SCSIO 73927 TaxID=3114537 RepID=UPI0030CBE122
MFPSHRPIAVTEGMRTRDPGAIRLATAVDIARDVAPAGAGRDVLRAGTASTGKAAKAAASMARAQRWVAVGLVAEATRRC